MENFYSPQIASPIKGAVFTFYDPTVSRKLTATNDIGRATAECFCNAEKWEGREITLAGDALTAEEIVTLFKEVKGEELGTQKQELPPSMEAYLSVSLSVW